MALFCLGDSGSSAVSQSPAMALFRTALMVLLKHLGSPQTCTSPLASLLPQQVQKHRRSTQSCLCPLAPPALCQGAEDKCPNNKTWSCFCAELPSAPAGRGMGLNLEPNAASELLLSHGRSLVRIRWTSTSPTNPPSQEHYPFGNTQRAHPDRLLAARPRYPREKALEHAAELPCSLKLVQNKPS